MSKRKQRRQFREETRDDTEVTVHDVDAAGYGDIHRKLEAVGGDKLRLRNDGTMEFSGFQLSYTGITEFGDDIEKFAQFLHALDTSIQWWLGDLLVHAERDYGLTYKDFAEKYDFEVSTLYQYKYVAERVEFSIRIENLSFAHHQVVASLSSKDKEHFLKQATKEDWSVRELREAIKAARNNGQTVQGLQPSEKHIHAVQKYFTKTRWQKLSDAEKQSAYNSLRGILQQMEDWGV